MATKQITVERHSVTSAKSFGDVVAGVDARIGHPDMAVLRREIAGAGTYAELETFIHGVVESSDLIEFVRFDIGEVLARSLPGTPGRAHQGPEALKIAPDLDAKVEVLLRAASR